MPTLRIELPAYVSQTDVKALRGNLVVYGYVDELPSASYAPQAVLLGISFVSGMLQSVEALANCLRRTPQG